MKLFIIDVRNFLLESYRSDHLSFFLELINFVASASASIILVFTTLNPELKIIYPLFLVGSLCQTYAGYRRKLVWIMLLVGFYTILNMFGCLRVFYNF